ncbi:MAG: RHS repeat-associated core domain-containing protein [Gemmataceae bacterium]
MTRYLRGGGIDELHARVSSSGTVDWYLTDQQRSVRHMTDNSGVVQNTIVYDAFGNITSESNASFGDRYKWTGREYDTETGLQYNRARYYDPAIGRWIHRDPIGFDAGDRWSWP